MTTADRVFKILIENLPEDGQSENTFWACPEAGEILCNSELRANSFYKLLCALGADDYAETGYYDPIRDEEIGATDGRTGYYFVRLNEED